MDNRERAQHIIAVLKNTDDRLSPVRIIEAELNRLETPNVLTCVYCGQAYPEGTPPHGAQVLTDHIRVCEKHPMRKVEQERDMLRKALAGLVGASEKSELEQMELGVRVAPAPEQDKINALNAIHALIATHPQP